MRAASERSAFHPGRRSAPATVGRTVSATWALTLMYFFAINNLRYRRLRRGGQPRIVAGHRRLQQLQQERQLLGGVPGQIVILGVADGQLGVLVAEVGRVDGRDRRGD